MPTFFNDEILEQSIQDTEILTLGWYFPTKGEHLPYFRADMLSKHILNIKSDYKNEKEQWKKDKITESFNYFKHLLNSILGKEVVIAVVPSSDLNKEWHRITRFINFLTKHNKNLVNGNTLLQRTQKIEKLSEGGDKSCEVHESSLVINALEKVAEKKWYRKYDNRHCSSGT